MVLVMAAIVPASATTLPIGLVAIAPTSSPVLVMAALVVATASAAVVVRPAITSVVTSEPAASVVLIVSGRVVSVGRRVRTGSGARPRTG